MIMKTRSKLLLAAVSLLTVSVAATATSAYAWFTANRQASAGITSMGVQSTAGSLSISHKAGSDTFANGEVTLDNSGAKPVLTGKTTQNITDVSSNGNGTFVKPKFDAAGENRIGEYGQSTATVKGQKTVTLTNGLTAYGVVTLAITLTNDGKDGVANKISVYLNPKNASLTSTNEILQKSARFSIVDLDNSDTVLFYCSPTAASETSYTYLSTATGNEEAISGPTILDKRDGGFFDANTNMVTTSSTKNNIPANRYLCDIAAGESHNFLITMWVEGTDTDCKYKSSDDATTTDLGSLNLIIDLYALEA